MRFILCFVGLFLADDTTVELPPVQGVEFASLRLHCRNLLEALDKLKAPLPPATLRELQTLLRKSDNDPETAVKIQKLLDPQCLIAVIINPESRVKAARGPAPAELVQGRTTVVLVKVQNDAGLTHALAISGPQIQSAGKRQGKRWLRAEIYKEAPMKRKLGGGKVEYVIVRMTAHQAGKREATLVFDAGQGTQDLGFRAEVPVLFTIRERAK